MVNLSEMIPSLTFSGNKWLVSCCLLLVMDTKHHSCGIFELHLLYHHLYCFRI